MVTKLLLKLIAGSAGLLEAVVRSVDAWWGGTTSVGRFHGRSLLAFFLPLPVFAFIVYGPALFGAGGGPAWRGPAAALILAVAIGLQIAYFLQNRLRKMAWVHAALVAALSLAAFLLADGGATQASPRPYRHYYGPLASLAMAVAVPIAWWLRGWRLFAAPPGILEEFRDACDAGRLVSQPRHRAADGWDILRAYLVAILRTPLHVLAPVAFVVILAPPGELKLWAAAAALISWALFATSNYDPEQDAFVRFFHRSFLSGGSLLVTLAVFVLAALRLAGVDYVTTVLDAGAKRTVLSYLFSTYSLLWLYDFWVEQAALELLGNPAGLCGGREGLRRHGSGRILAIAGPAKDQRRMFGPTAFLRRIAETAPESQRRHLRDEAERLSQRLRAYMLSCSFILASLLIGAGIHLHGLPQSDGMTVAPDAAPATLDLAERLRQAGPQPVVMLAASGGGTRAALYTAAVLHGLQRLDRLDRLVVGSGVSGGSAALAYYAAHREELHGGEEAAWRLMRERLAAPFIDDVLAGAGEWRMVAGGRLGSLLSESFERRLGPGDTGFPGSSGIGLIFNASLCGVDEGDLSSGAARGETADQAGGRLVITNLNSAFDRVPVPSPDGWDLDLPFRVVLAPRMSLFEAAALSANFPPVFSNAAVYDAGAGKRYWVTDGGAVENRGAISILLALVEALARIEREPAESTGGIPDVTVVVADASAFDPAYSSDRGLKAKFGASEQLANRLTRELLARADGLHESITGRRYGVRIVYLSMPDALRVAGTFGTHWMMPRRISFRDLSAREGTAPPIVLDRAATLEIIDAIFSPEYSLESLQQRWPDVKGADRIYQETGALWGRLKTFAGR